MFPLKMITLTRQQEIWAARQLLRFAGTGVVGVVCCPGFPKKPLESIELHSGSVGAVNPFLRVSSDFQEGFFKTDLSELQNCFCLPME